MKTKSQIKGRKGEAIASHYLEKKGYFILERNFHSRWGEIDIICRGPFEEIVFVEVKNYKKNSFLHPLEAITVSKQEKLSLTGDVYLAQYDMQNCDCRFDMIIVQGELVQDHFLNIF